MFSERGGSVWDGVRGERPELGLGLWAWWRQTAPVRAPDTAHLMCFLPATPLSGEGGCWCGRGGEGDSEVRALVWAQGHSRQGQLRPRPV